MFDEHEPAKFELTPDLAAVERQLARITPAAPRIDRDRLMFEAGRAAARPKRPGYIAEPFRLGAQFWPAATVAMTAATLLLAMLLILQRQEKQIASQDKSPSLTVPKMETAPATPTVHLASNPELPRSGSSIFGPSTNGYLGIRNIVLTQGIGTFERRFTAANGDRESSTETEATQRDLLQKLLPAAERASLPRS